MQICINQPQPANSVQMSYHLWLHTENLFIKTFMQLYKSRRHLTTDCPFSHIDVYPHQESLAQIHGHGQKQGKLHFIWRPMAITIKSSLLLQTNKEF